MTKELIEDIRKTLIPFVKKELLEINNDGLGELDAEEFERDFNEILDLAIKALEQPTSDDCVSRAEVIDELNRLGRNAFKDDTDYDNFFAFVDSLPPVTPTHETCKDCKRYNRNEMFCTWHGGYLMQKCDPKYFCADFEKRGDSDGRN